MLLRILLLFLACLFPSFTWAQESQTAPKSSGPKIVCVDKNILLQGHFTVKLSPKKTQCEKNEEEMEFVPRAQGGFLLFPLQARKE